MTNSEFIKGLSNRIQLPYKRTDQLLVSMTSILIAKIRSSNTIRVPMFASFYNQLWGKPNQHNLHGGGLISYPSRVVAKCKREDTFYQQLNPAWLPSRTFGLIRIYPDSELANAMFLADPTDLWQCRMFVFEFGQYMTALIDDDEKITLRYLGTFYRKYRASYTGKNPRTGAPVTVPERWSLRFRPSPILKEQLA